MSAQDTYEIELDRRIHGSLNDLNDNELQSGNAEAVIAIGIAVARGTLANQVVVAGDADFLGISIRDLSKEGQIDDQTINYEIGDNVSVLRSGRINITCPAGCTAGDPVKYTDADGVLDAGAPAAGETAIGGATWETTTSAGGVGIVRLPDNVTIA